MSAIAASTVRLTPPVMRSSLFGGEDAVGGLLTDIRRHHEFIAGIHAAATAEEKSRALDHARAAGRLIPGIAAAYNERRRTDPESPGWKKGATSVLGFSYQTASTYERIANNWKVLDKALQGEERSIRGAVRWLQKKNGTVKGRRTKWVAIEEVEFLAALHEGGPGKVLNYLNDSMERNGSRYRLSFSAAKDRKASFGTESENGKARFPGRIGEGG